MMDHKQEHVATLCAFGTIGLAVAGLALGAGEETILTRPGKRKSPGSDAAYTSSSPMLPPSRRTVSGPSLPVSTPSPAATRSLSTSLFRRKRPADLERDSTDGSLPTQSRGSSANRSGGLPRAFGQIPAVEEEEPRPHSSWRRRLSTMSSLSSQSPAPSTYKFDMTPTSTPMQPSAPDSNRLVKRSTSQRHMPTDQSKRRFLRPATSHQRSASMMAMPVSTPSPSNLRQAYQQGEERPMSSASIWRPFFTSGYSRKRPTTPGTREVHARTVSTPYAQRPTLVNARTVQRQSLDEDTGRRDFQSSPVLQVSAPRQRLRRSLSSFRKNGGQRFFTDPVVGVSSQNAHGSILPTKHSPLSPVSRSSTFDIDLPPGTPIFTSSPLIAQASRANPSINKRISVAPSDPNTVSSDNDTKLFSDDESMDFHSDTAYDSLATRATVSSQSGHRQPKIDAIFDDSNLEQSDGRVQTLEALMRRSNLNENDLQSTRGTSAWSENVGIGIHGLDDDDDDDNMESEGPQTLTPVREHPFGSVEELNATPIAFRRGVATMIGSSPPSSVVRSPIQQSKGLSFAVSEDVEMKDEDSIDWSPKSDKELKKINALGPDSPITRRTARLLNAGLESESKRSSIFDWSENQKSPAETPNGISPRPKTVHGKQGDEQNRSRAAGRRGPSAIHFRSQSVPVNRETGSDLEVPPPNAKFGTWGLGNKPVSEEWSDDFEFDDVEEEVQPLRLAPGPRDSVRSVKVPQSIIDRQASVHQQFSQVQEFMTLVEELRRLRSQGAQLDLLDSQSRQLWDDAENIINLATLNEEDEASMRPSSPISSDIFGEDASPGSRRISTEDSKHDSFGIRSVSGPATPPSVTRPRGESLAHAKTFLQTIHQNRGTTDLSPPQQRAQREKLPFDTQDLRDLVVKAGVITRALKDIVRKAQGVSVSPERTPQKQHDPTFSHIFNPPDSSPSPPLARKGAIPNSRSTNSYLSDTVGSEHDLPTPLKLTMIEV